MKYLFLSYYYPPDIGAGAFRSKFFVNNFIKKLSQNDELIIISSTPNRYDVNLNANKVNTINDKRVKIHKIKVFNHKEKLPLKILSGIKYFLYACALIFKSKPDICISSTARIVSGLAVYLPSIFLKYKYFIDVRDIFSEVMRDILPKNFINKILIILIYRLEKKIFSSATSVNFVSEGFKTFIKKNNIILKDVTFFTNGMDEIFIANMKPLTVNSIKKILYIGNIGEGQALEKIIPNIASRLNHINFTIIGDGGKKLFLNKLLINKKITNVELLKPRSQEELLNSYREADALFLHLNNYDSLKNVIPSKIFEYASFNKPVLAGVSGYTKVFCNQFKNFYFFEPCDVDGLMKIIKNLKDKIPIKMESNNNILDEFNRNFLMEKYVNHVKKMII